jgi:hypothetical protein
LVSHKIQSLDTSELSGPEGKRGYCVSGNEAWTNVPYLNWNRDDRKVQLNANWSDNRNQNWAAPVVRDYSNDKGG